MKKLCSRFFLLFMLLALSACMSGDHVFRISQDSLQTKLREKLPVTKSYLRIFQVTLENPRVALHEGSDRIHLGLEVAVRILNAPEPLRGEIDVSGGLRYDHPQGAFYLVTPTLERMNLHNLPEQYREPAHTVLSGLLTEYCATHPLYVLDAKKRDQTPENMQLKNVRVENGELALTFGQ
ncbi:MAG: DUF1439 domain-containing protein [Zoogloeaceae bacterium]|nr:DUF1439 domain-containing protein [Zoogloeaceae bacterium]